MITANIAFNGYVGLSTDTKPSANNGSRFYEMDTQKSYMYDQEGGQWIEQPTSGGGGAGGGVTVIEVEETGTRWELQSTWAEIKDAFLSGTAIVHAPDNLPFSKDTYYAVTSVVANINDGQYSVYFDMNGSIYQCVSLGEDENPTISWD